MLGIPLIGVCPHCKQNAGIESETRNLPSSGGAFPVAIVRCANCKSILGVTPTREAIADAVRDTVKRMG
ncbi:MAG: hypothetical protein OEM52_05975 [bacterium]|nr:hypothetical protein [bacterium]